MSRRRESFSLTQQRGRLDQEGTFREKDHLFYEWESRTHGASSVLLKMLKKGSGDEERQK